IGLQPGEAEIPSGGDTPRERQRRLARRDAASSHADFDLDVHVELRTARLERLDIVRVVDAYADMRALRELGEARDLLRADDLVADEHICDAAIDERFGFRDFLAANAHGAHRELALGD